jgi:hypothetical protein
MAIAPNADLDQRIENILHDKLSHFLTDIDFRIGQANDIVNRATTPAAGIAAGGKVYAEDLNLIGRHMLTGYTVTANSPGAGSISWANLHMVYNGTDTTITDGNTNLKYVWWSSTTTPTVLQVSNTKPVLQAGEVLLFMNAGGTAKVMLSDTNASMPQILSDGAVDSTSIIANAVGTSAIAFNAITGSQIADNAVGSAAVNANAITSAKVADGAVNRAGQLSGKIVGTGVIVANAITGTEVADNAVSRAGQLGANVVTSTKLADGAIARSAQLSANTVTTSAVAPNAITANELLNGAVSASKLSILRHVLY